MTSQQQQLIVKSTVFIIAIFGQAYFLWGCLNFDYSDFCAPLSNALGFRENDYVSESPNYPGFLVDMFNYRNWKDSFDLVLVYADFFTIGIYIVRIIVVAWAASQIGYLGFLWPFFPFWFQYFTQGLAFAVALLLFDKSRARLLGVLIHPSIIIISQEKLAHPYVLWILIILNAIIVPSIPLGLGFILLYWPYGFLNNDPRLGDVILAIIALFVGVVVTLVVGESEIGFGEFYQERFLLVILGISLFRWKISMMRVTNVSLTQKIQLLFFFFIQIYYFFKYI